MFRGKEKGERRKREEGRGKENGKIDVSFIRNEN
jgi:hypothetical protein